VFDSGIGGLTVLRALHARLPGHDYVYLGDIARLPYGTRSPRTVARYSLQVASFLLDQGVDAIIIACNTATTYALDHLQAACDPLGIPVIGVVGPGVQAALGASEGGGLGLLGTTGTIQGGAYARELERVAPGRQLYGVACPLLVPLVEEGWLDGAVPQLVATHYLAELPPHVDTVILGCTHYPLLRPTLQRLRPDICWVDASVATADAAAALGPVPPGHGHTEFFVTDHVERFKGVGATFLGRVPQDVSWVDLPPATRGFWDNL